MEKEFGDITYETFQFHNGTINTMLRILIAHLYMCFNSTTVQLIPRAIARNVRVDIVFQFHNGTINTVFAVTETMDKI